MIGIKINPVNPLMREAATSYPQEQGMPLGLYGAGMENLGVFQ